MLTQMLAVSVDVEKVFMFEDPMIEWVLIVSVIVLVAIRAWLYDEE
mgnify:CR=1 FL=1